MLKKIPRILSPELVKIMMEMGHGDEIVLADGNFPAASHAQRLVQCAGHPIPPLLSAILELFPLDTYVDRPVTLMQIVPGDQVDLSIWDEYRSIVHDASGDHVEFDYLERFDFYERARTAYAIVSTGESAQYANIILRKGVIKA